MEYNPNNLEKKWQKYWQDKKIFQAKDNDKKKKFYGLIEFPYPSGDGLHTGHLRSYTALDIVCRKRRMQGFNVLYPIGMDAFGLPAENYAVKTNTPPQITTQKNIAIFNKQLTSGGYSFDWSRFLATTDQDYYKWTQWIFIQMFKKGLAYKAKENINWCTSCHIGLANEEVVNGVCERCDGKVVKQEKEQWLLKITDYADRLIEGLDKIDFLETIKKQQKDWIGRSEGAEVDFKIKDTNEILRVFTTRPDTLFGSTFMVVAPEQEIVLKLKDKIKNYTQVNKYIAKAKQKTDIQRGKTKTGIELKGIKAINPVNNQEIPIFVADYVLMTYGTGAIMAVPAHDQRDYEFAKKYKLDIVPVIAGGDIKKKAYTDTNSGKIINSGEYNGLTVKEFQPKIVQWLDKNKLGIKAINYKLHDWIFSRQRYWGEPIPMVHCDKCGWLPVDEKDLPVVLPDIKDFKPTKDGQSPLAKVTDWVKTKCSQCKGEARRETDVMPNWAGSNWYFIRYTDPKNNKELVDKQKAKYWLPVDWYNGGMEHTNLHLLYSRFVFKFLYDIGVIPKECGDEPYKKRTAQGMILGKGGIKMSKSKGNVVNPDDYVKKYGSDTVRVYEMFIGPFDQAVALNDKGVIGVYRFLTKVFNLQTKVKGNKQDKDTEKLLHQTIKKVSDDIDNMRFNTAVSALMILTNHFEKQKEVSKDSFSIFLKLLSPFAAHLAEELWNKLGNKNSIALETWPKHKDKLAQAEMITLGIQVNGKLRDSIALAFNIEASDKLKKEILSRSKLQKYIQGKDIKKFIHIKNRIISIVVK